MKDVLVHRDIIISRDTYNDCSEELTTASTQRDFSDHHPRSIKTQLHFEHQLRKTDNFAMSPAPGRTSINDAAPTLPRRLISPVPPTTPMNISKDGTLRVPKRRISIPAISPVSLVSPTPATPKKTLPKVLGMMDQMLELHDEEMDDDDYSCASYESLTFGDDLSSAGSFDDDSFSSDEESYYYEEEEDYSSSSSSCTSYSYVSQTEREVDVDVDVDIDFDDMDHTILPNQQERCVRFAPTGILVTIPHHSDYSHQERRSMYLSRDEIKGIRRRCHRAVQKLEGESLPSRNSKRFRGLRKNVSFSDDEYDDDDFCFRGLEQHTLDYSAKRSELHQLLYISVFKVQSLAIPGVDIEGTIAGICQNISAIAVSEAHEIGLSDAREVNHD